MTLFGIIPLVMLCCAVQPAELTFQQLKDPLQVGFLKEGLIYTTQRIGIVDDKTRTALASLQLYVIPFVRKGHDGKTSCFEPHDRLLIMSPAKFLRWRLTSSNNFWGTECSLDDHETGIFRIPLRIMKSLDPVNASPGKKVKRLPGLVKVRQFSWRCSSYPGNLR